MLFAVNQLAEIATRALSPGTNDPNTAIMCIDRLNEGLCRLAGRSFPSDWRADRTRRPCAALAKAPSFADVLHAAFAQIRRYGRQDAQVLDAAARIDRRHRLVRRRRRRAPSCACTPIWCSPRAATG